MRRALRFPMFHHHMLVTRTALVPQILTKPDLKFMLSLLASQPIDQLVAYYNSWSAGASVNHMHWHLCQARFKFFDFYAASELRLRSGSGAPCREWPSRPMVWTVSSHTPVDAVCGDVAQYIQRLLSLELPHNVAMSHSSGHLIVAVFTRSADPALRGRRVIGFDAGCAEMCGDFTFYKTEDSKSTSDSKLTEFLQNTCLNPELTFLKSNL